MDVVAPSVASREMLRAVAVVGVGGEARVWSPVAVGEKDALALGARATANAALASVAAGGEATTTFSGFARAGFVAVAAAKQAHARSAPFAHIHVRVAPVAVSSAPSATRASGGGVAWLSARARDGRRGGGVVRRRRGGSTSASTSTSTRAVSSALVSFETPACAIGSGTLALAVGRGGGADVVVDATLATTFLPEAFVFDAATTSKDWSLESFETSVARASAASETAIRPDGGMVTLVGVGFRDSGGASCRFGTVGPASARVASATEMSCATPRLAAGRRAIEVSFNGREHTRESGVFLLVAPAPPRVEGIVPTAIPARDAASTSAVIAVVAGRNVDADARFGFGDSGSVSVGGDARFGFVSVSVAPVGAFAAIRAGGVSAVDASHVALFAAPRVDASDPSAGPATGGTLVVVVGADFRRLVDDEYPPSPLSNSRADRSSRVARPWRFARYRPRWRSPRRPPRDTTSRPFASSRPGRAPRRRRRPPSRVATDDVDDVDDAVDRTRRGRVARRRARRQPRRSRTAVVPFRDGRAHRRATRGGGGGRRGDRGEVSLPGGGETRRRRRRLR